MNIDLVLDLLFTLNLSALALDHLATGGLAIIAPKKATKLYKDIFGFTLPDNESYMAIIKPWGALGVFAGVVGVLPILQPEHHLGVLVALVILLLIRIYIRSRFSAVASESFSLHPRRNLLHIGLIALCASLIMMQIVWIILNSGA